MTIPEITAYVMALSVEDVRRLTATDVMGWTLITSHTGNVIWDGSPGRLHSHLWRPDHDRNQSRQVTDKVVEYLTIGNMRDANFDLLGWWKIGPLDESRAALIAHMIHKEENKT